MGGYHEKARGKNRMYIVPFFPPEEDWRMVGEEKVVAAVGKLVWISQLTHVCKKGEVCFYLVDNRHAR